MAPFPDLEARPRIDSIGVGIMPVPGITRWPLQTRWALHQYQYSAVLQRGEVTTELRPGLITLTPPQTLMAFTGPRQRGEHLYCTFTMPAEPGSVPFPSTIDSGSEARRLYDRFAAALACHGTTPTRAELLLWTLLWDLRDRYIRAATTRDSAAASLARDTAHYIELHLQQPLRVADVAREMGVSHNHLTRVFQSRYGCTVVAYLRRRRVDRACSLLRQTDMPLKAIAAQLGFADAHQFNKAVRRELGRPPSALRRGA